ncbi:Scr1 family TA system antitoxin-like transcriptional regulator [Streptomyces zaomyceticus]|uniref:Scr1 family TA system antitoxin-like transcriptional regulator n=1 Tax=Streptomyces zaomyceticus TaxID=68286 RepID=UPI002E1D9FAC
MSTFGAALTTVLCGAIGFLVVKGDHQSPNAARPEDGRRLLCQPCPLRPAPPKEIPVDDHSDQVPEPEALDHEGGEPEGGEPEWLGLPGPENIAVPWPPSRVYDYLTGGNESFMADRKYGDELIDAVPWAAVAMQINKQHRVPAALTLASLGIRQFIDLGCGYPSRYDPTRGFIPAHTLDIVRTVHDDARVVYADIEGYVYGHANMAMAESRSARALRADARDIPVLLRDVEQFLDLAKPVGVLLHDVLPWLGDDEAGGVLRSLHELLPPGSAVSVTHATGDHDPEDMATLVRMHAEIGVAYRPRGLHAIRDLLRPWAVLGSGIVPTAQWADDKTPSIPKNLRTGWKLDLDHSHAYAAVTVPKAMGPVFTLDDHLLVEPEPAPGHVLIGACLKALRESKGIPVEDVAREKFTTPLAILKGEAGNPSCLQYDDGNLGKLDRWDARDALELFRRHSNKPWSSDSVTDCLPGNIARAFALLGATNHARIFASDRIPDPFQTPSYTERFPLAGVFGADADEGVHAPRAELAPTPHSWTAVLDEALLIRATGDDAMMLHQLDHLLNLTDLPHITIQVLRLDSPIASPVAHLVEHRFATGRSLWREDGFTYTNRDRGSRRGLMLDRALEHAEPEDTSRRLIAEARDRLSQRMRAADFVERTGVILIDLAEESNDV